MSVRKSGTFIAITSLLGLTFACSSGPAPPKPGTAAFSWEVAKESYQAGDYLRTAEHLDRVLRTDNDLVPQARVWRLVLGAGLADAYRELTEQFEQGGRTNKANPTPFRRKAVDYRTLAERTAVLLGEFYSNFEKAQATGDVELHFPYPARGSLSLPPAIIKIAQGQVPTEGDIVTAQSAMLQRAVLANICAAVGASNDAARAQQLLKEIPAKVPRGAFEYAMAEALYEASTVFGPLKGSQPVRQLRLLELAGQALAKATGDEKKIKELKAKIERDTKEANKKRS